MKYLISISFLVCCAGGMFGQSPAGWTVIKDQSKACQFSVPANWVAATDLPGKVTTPDHTSALIMMGVNHTKLTPLSDDAQRTMGVDKVFENTTQRLFTAAKPTDAKDGQPSLTAYHVEVPAKDGRCVAQITVRSDHSLDEVKKIAASVTATP